MYEALLIAYLVVAIMLVGFVLIQQGKGADMGASFGSGGSNTIFGSSGSGNFMTKTTAILATLFFAISLIIGGMTSSRFTAEDEFETITPISQEQDALGDTATDASLIPVAVDSDSIEDAAIPVAEEEIQETEEQTEPQQ